MKQFFLTLLVFLLPTLVYGDMLKGSKAKRDEAYQMAKAHNLSFAQDITEVKKLVEAGVLVKLKDDKYFKLNPLQLSFPYVLPETLIFIKQISEFVHQKCKQVMIINSAMRPISKNERLAGSVPDSVHPTGMAVDFRKVHLSKKCRSWLEARLRYLAYKGAIQATEYRRSSRHYHVVVYPTPFIAFLASSANDDTGLHEVASGETLSGISLAHGENVMTLASHNKLSSPDRLRSGQLLFIP